MNEITDAFLFREIGVIFTCYLCEMSPFCESSEACFHCFFTPFYNFLGVVQHKKGDKFPK